MRYDGIEISVWKSVFQFKLVQKTHIYYAMKNCNGDVNTLKNYITNIVDSLPGKSMVISAYNNVNEFVAGQIDSSDRFL